MVFRAGYCDPNTWDVFPLSKTSRVFRYSILHGKPFGISLPMYAVWMMLPDQLNVGDIHFQWFMLSLDALS